MEDKQSKFKTVKLTSEELDLAQNTTRSIVYQIHDNLKDGMTSEEAKQMSIDIFKKNNVFKWHDVQVQFAENTNYGYNCLDQLKPNIKYDSNDIVFIDIGVVVNKTLEGDYGQSFYKGKDERLQKLVQSAQKFWQFGHDLWVKNQKTITGVELYQKIQQEVEKENYQFYTAQGGQGHHIGVFLHQQGNKLCEYKGIIEDCLWILEIFVHDSKLNRSSFYENALSLKINSSSKL